jgi:hypothetical protein
MIPRRGFLAGMLAIGAAPAIVTSKGFLPLHTPRRLVRSEFGQFTDIRIVQDGGHALYFPVDWPREKARKLKPLRQPKSDHYLITIAPDRSLDLRRA